ncbi:MAG TPA: tetratricopeptide repeat protein [Myxococcus sp.]|nr:tetratricopeptide repeat protein [Myxococcus sp.]
MNTMPCTKLHLFVDGELPEGDAEAYRQHLTRCAECEVGLRDLLQLEMLAARALQPAGGEAPGKVTPLRPWMQQAWRAAVPVALAAGLAAVGVLRYQAEPQVPPEVWLESASGRTMEARLSHAQADRFKPFSPMRGSALAPEPVSLRPLAQMEERNDYRGIAAAYALRGDWQQAEAFLAKAPDSVATSNDRAALALSKRQWEEALELLTGALRKEPRHPQALWNRGLALRELGLSQRAEEAFRQVAALPGQEAGWVGEALMKADELREDVRKEQERWSGQVREARKLLADGADAAEVQQLSQQKAVARAALYETVRTATDAAVVRSLMPLARELDGGGEPVLQDYVKATAARDFTVRAPLAREYQKLLDGQASPGVLDMLRHADAQDLYFGAVLLTGAAVKDEEAFKALQRFAHVARDPWLHLLVEREQARRQDADGKADSAEQRLLTARRTCGAYTAQFRCAELQ